MKDLKILHVSLITHTKTYSYSVYKYRKRIIFITTGQLLITLVSASEGKALRHVKDWGIIIAESAVMQGRGYVWRVLHLSNLRPRLLLEGTMSIFLRASSD